MPSGKAEKWRLLLLTVECCTHLCILWAVYGRNSFSLWKQLVRTVTPVCYRANIRCVLGYFSRPARTYHCMYGRVILKCYENKRFHTGLFLRTEHVAKEQAGCWFWKSVAMGSTQFPRWGRGRRQLYLRASGLNGTDVWLTNYPFYCGC